MPRSSLVAVALALVLSACNAVGYHSRSINGGYSETRLHDDVWRIIYTGDPPTNHETLQAFWLYRATELTLAQGFQGFEMVIPMLSGDPDRPGFRPFQIAAGFVYIPIMVPAYSSSAPPVSLVAGEPGRR